MRMTDSILVPALVAMGAGVLMVRAGQGPARVAEESHR